MTATDATNTANPTLDDLLAQMSQFLLTTGDLPPADTPVGQLTREFFGNTWQTCQQQLLTKTDRIHVMPEGHPARMFHFEFDLPYRQKFMHSHQVNLMSGPIRGIVMYRPDLMANLHQPSVAVRLDPSMGYFHPNYSREHGLVCLGDLPPGPFPLEGLLEHHLFPILSYQNRRPVHPADAEAARYFATNPEAMIGLEPVLPLY